MAGGLSASDVETFVLPDELGHETGKLGDDRASADQAGQDAAKAFNIRIATDSFGLKAQ